MKTPHTVAALLREIRARPDLQEQIRGLLLAGESAPNVCDAPAQAYKIVRPYLLGGTVERLVAVALDRRNRVLGAQILTQGSDACTVVDPRQIFRWALLQGRSGANAIILAHNHPSGDSAPSRQDIEVTLRVAAAGRVVGVNLLDHLIVTDTTYTSLADQGHVPSGPGPAAYHT